MWWKQPNGDMRGMMCVWWPRLSRLRGARPGGNTPCTLHCRQLVFLTAHCITKVIRLALLCQFTSFMAVSLFSSLGAMGKIAVNRKSWVSL
ncbi:hypothetical protein T440DRAFT_198058 [Plenodomus tracheiphilus IPT5]|uniref:Uncharacterized protein n=1 Tax=Plenodomus tracheiphilus IPT5 TaxID=1408161 RepID=A0A6A7BHR5_9PLEO|nr:hypothetical protein T440DRAFT_198058 [Plenodomus tracheiphilus IPT5]